MARNKPAMAAIANEMNAAFLTALAVAKPLPTNLIGPTRLLSVPRMPSLKSFA
ncbi:unannotated protein [freshwater metagenome]|uniref:Unannotated protein n=1 Tax=freshwater metagenome TaxID=449393 RepID=A0A6J6Q192_9ZZZZ